MREQPQERRQQYANINRTGQSVVNNKNSIKKGKRKGKEKMKTVINFDEIRSEMKQVLEVYSHPYTDDNLDRAIFEWYKAKAPLIEFLEKNPNWDEKNLRIETTVVEQRKVDIYQAIDRMRRLLNECSNEWATVLHDIGRKVSEKTSEQTFEQIKDLYVEYCQAHYKYQLADIIRDYCVDLSEYTDSGYVKMVSKKTLEEFLETYPIYKRIHLHDGERLSKVLLRLLKLAECDKVCSDFERQFAIISDLVNQKGIDMQYCISVHPVDYLLMSYGNSWRSCHMIDGGGWQNGAFSYMLDESTVEFYSYTKDTGFKSPHMIPKVRRNMVMLSPNRKSILQSRLYPNNSEELRVQVRNFLQEQFALCLGEENNWTKLSRSTMDFIETIDKSTHYKDYENSEYRTVFQHSSIKRNAKDEQQIITVGAIPFCLECGKENPDEEYFSCWNCRHDDVDMQPFSIENALRQLQEVMQNIKSFSSNSSSTEQITRSLRTSSPVTLVDEVEEEVEPWDEDSFNELISG